MKTLFAMSHRIIFLLCITICSLNSQIDWSKFGNNPVLTKDTTALGTRDWAGIGQPTCLFKNDTFKIWYTAAGVACIGDTILHGRISYAHNVSNISIFDATGRFVRNMTRSTSHTTVSKAYIWDGRDYTGKILPEGVYFILGILQTWGHENKGIARQITCACLEFHGFINLSIKTRRRLYPAEP